MAAASDSDPAARQGVCLPADVRAGGVIMVLGAVIVFETVRRWCVLLANGVPRAEALAAEESA